MFFVSLLLLFTCMEGFVVILVVVNDKIMVEQKKIFNKGHLWTISKTNLNFLLDFVVLFFIVSS